MVARLDGAAPEDVETLLLTPLEAQLMGIAGLEHLEGWADEGVATVQVRIRGEDPTAIRDALQDAPLPADADAPVIQRDRESAWFVVPVEGAEEVALRLTREVGIHAVDVHGGRDERIVITVDAARLAAYGLDLAAIADALAKPVEWPVGRIEGDFVVRTRHDGGIDRLGEIVVGVVQGVPIRLDDVASLELRAGDPRALHDGGAVSLLEIASDRPDLADLVGGTPLAGRTRVDLVGPDDWVRAFSSEPDAVLLVRDGGGTAWIADPTRAHELALTPGIDAIVRSGVCGEEAVYADTIDALEQAVQERRRALTMVGVTTWTGWAPARDQLEVVVDRERAAAAGVSATEIAAAAAVAEGRVVATVQEGGRALDVVVEAELDGVHVRGVPLSAVARFEHGRQRAVPHVDGRRGVHIEVCGDARALAELGITP